MRKERGTRGRDRKGKEGAREGEESVEGEEHNGRK